MSFFRHMRSETLLLVSPLSIHPGKWSCGIVEVSIAATSTGAVRHILGTLKEWLRIVCPHKHMQDVHGMYHNIDMCPAQNHLHSVSSWRFFSEVGNDELSHCRLDAWRRRRLVQRTDNRKDLGQRKACCIGNPSWTETMPEKLVMPSKPCTPTL